MSVQSLTISKNEPYKYMFGEQKKHLFFVNKKNSDGLTPLYVVIINGHLKLVKVLIEHGADHLIKTGKDNDESILELSIRWKMVKIFEYLLNELTWPKEYLEKAFEVAKELKNSSAVKDLKFKLKKYNESKKCSCFFFSD